MELSRRTYCTRVGEGPFPTELALNDKSPGKHLATVGPNMALLRDDRVAVDGWIFRK